jgi:hypothetical protein
VSPEKKALQALLLFKTTKRLPKSQNNDPPLLRDFDLNDYFTEDWTITCVEN